MATNKFLTIVGNVRSLVTAISSSSGAGDANKIVATSSGGKIDLSLMPNGIGPNTATIIASEALAAGDFVNIFNDAGTRKVRKADASNNRPAHGFVSSAVIADQNASVSLSGENSSLTGLTPGVAQFLSATTAGAATTTAPIASGSIVQELGYSASSTSIVFEFDAPITIA